MTTATRHPFVISQTFSKEDSDAIHSDAIRMIELIPALEGTDAYDVLITYHSSDKVYRYEVDNDATAERWYHLLNDPTVCSVVSWGREVNHARAHGDILDT